MHGQTQIKFNKVPWESYATHKHVVWAKQTFMLQQMVDIVTIGL